MVEKSGGMLFRKRNILGAALVAGVGLGVYFGDWFKGPGLGGGNSAGVGSKDGKTQTSIGSTNPVNDSPDSKNAPETKNEQVPTQVPDVVKVLIDERQFLLRQANEDVPISLPNLIKLIQQAPGDVDGFQVRIYERMTARPSAEEDLKKALIAANIPDAAVLWVPHAMTGNDKRRSNSPSDSQ